MDTGVVLMRSVTASPGNLTRLARTIEELDLHSIWVTEHMAIPVDIASRYPYSEDGRPAFGPETEWPEAMVALGFVAAVTRRVRLGTAVIPMITRDPISMAKQAATVDALSGGRLELGLGAGWLLEEAEVLGHPHDHRGERLDEAIDIMRRAWTQPTFSHRGRFWQIPSVGVHPHPPQGADLPIWIGGTRPAAIRTSADRATGNLLWMPTPAEVADMRARLPSDRRVAASMPFWYGRGDPAPRARALRDAGADLLLLVHYGEPAEVARDLGRFVGEALPSL